jgi:hypothetical protein
METIQKEVERLEFTIIELTKETDITSVDYYYKVERIKSIITRLKETLIIYKNL